MKTEKRGRSWGEKGWKLLIAFRRGYPDSSFELSISRLSH